MKRNTRTRRHTVVAVAVVVFTAVGLTVPFLLGDRSQRAMLRGAAVFAAGGDRYTLSEPLRLLSSPSVVLESGTVSVADTGASNGKKSLAAVLARGNPTLVLSGAVIRINPAVGPASIEQQKTGERGHDAIDGIVAPLLKVLASKRFGALSLQHCTVVIDNSDALPFRLDDVRLNVIVTDGSAVSASGSISYRGRDLKISTRVGLGAPRKDDARFPIRVTIDGDLVSTSFEGQILFGARPQIISERAKLQFPSLSETSQWLGLPWPSSSETDSFNAQGRLAWTGKTLAFQNASFRLGDNSANGTLSVNYIGTRPLIEGTLAADKLDVTRYVRTWSVSDQVAVLQPAEWLKQIGVRSPSSMVSLIRAVDADLRVSAKQVIGGQVVSRQTATTISLRDGKLLADLAEFELKPGGHGSVQVSLDVNGSVPKMGIRSRMRDVDVAGALQIAFGYPVLAGRGDLSFDVSGAGDSRFELLHTMNGKATVAVPGEAQLAIDLSALANSKRTAADETGWGLAGKGTTTLAKVSTELSFSNGVARTEDLSGVANGKAVSATGKFSLADKTLDLKISIGNLRPSVWPNGDNGTRPVVLHATGDWAKPDVTSLDHAENGASNPMKDPG